jgi:hypothetical protein
MFGERERESKHALQEHYMHLINLHGCNQCLKEREREREVSYSALFTNLFGWHTSAVTLPPGDVILAQLACTLNDVITNISL